MTLEELRLLDEVIQWAKGKVMSQRFFDKLIQAEFTIKREIKIKIIDPRMPKTDVNGNVIDYDY